MYGEYYHENTIHILMPFHQNEALIRQTARDLIQAFSWAPKFREYYAVKVCNGRLVVTRQSLTHARHCLTRTSFAHCTKKDLALIAARWVR